MWVMRVKIASHLILIRTRKSKTIEWCFNEVFQISRLKFLFVSISLEWSTRCIDVVHMTKSWWCKQANIFLTITFSHLGILQRNTLFQHISVQLSYLHFIFLSYVHILVNRYVILLISILFCIPFLKMYTTW